MEEKYGLRQYGENDEYHLFRTETVYGDIYNNCKFLGNADCSSDIDIDNSSSTDYQCLSEEEMREECASLGRKMCGKCIQELYKNI